jgi:hypothetical protein
MYKNYATYLGGFSNPEMAQKIANTKTYGGDESDFEKSWENIKEQETKEQPSLHRRRRVVK